MEFYRSINSLHQQKRSQNTSTHSLGSFFYFICPNEIAKYIILVFSLPPSVIQNHNELLRTNMRSTLVPSDAATLNGFTQCNNAAKRLLKRATGRDINCAAQLQRMQDAYEVQLVEQKAVAENQLRQMQMEVERW